MSAIDKNWRSMKQSNQIYKKRMDWRREGKKVKKNILVYGRRKGNCAGHAILKIEREK